MVYIHLNGDISKFYSYLFLLAHDSVFHLLPLGHYDVSMGVCDTNRDNIGDKARA